jgi:hypothetical protein
MPYIHRRIFYAKVGKADPLVNHFKEADQLMQQYGVGIKTRIMTDFFSGRSDTVVVEWESEQPGEIEAAMNRFMENPQARDAFAKWEAQLPDMINYSVAENWAIR